VNEGTYQPADIGAPDPPSVPAGAAAGTSGCRVAIDGADSTEAWDAFRARCWSLTRAGLRIDDVVAGRGRHEIVIRWPLSVGAIVRVTNDSALVTSAAGAFLMTIEASGPSVLGVEARSVATGSAGPADAPVLTCRMTADLPARVTTSWRRALADSAEKTT
jgi:hypothetical protein